MKKISSLEQVRSFAKSLFKTSSDIKNSLVSGSTEKASSGVDVSAETPALSNKDQALLALGVTPKRLRSASMKSALSSF